LVIEAERPILMHGPVADLPLRAEELEHFTFACSG